MSVINAYFFILEHLGEQIEEISDGLIKNPDPKPFLVPLVWKGTKGLISGIKVKIWATDSIKSVLDKETGL